MSAGPRSHAACWTGREERLRRLTGSSPRRQRASARAVFSEGGRWAVASRHLRGGARLCSQTPAHAAPCRPLPWASRIRPSAAPAVSSRSAPFSLRSCQAQPQTPALRCGAGCCAGQRRGGRALSADFVGIDGGPDAAQRLQFRVLACVFLESGARATRLRESHAAGRPPPRQRPSQPRGGCHGLCCPPSGREKCSAAREARGERRACACRRKRC
ncbi:MAG: hypothetical protein RLZZ142_2518 [Verrucomicrobiota bacterium]